MHKQSKIQIFTFLLMTLSFVLQAYVFIKVGSFPSVQSNRDIKNQCIEIDYGFSYSTNNKQESRIRIGTKWPQQPWRLVSTVPEQSANILTSKNLLLVTITDQHAEIWVKEDIFENATTNSKPQNRIMIYREIENKWIEYKSNTDKLTLLYMFETNDGDIWGLHYSKENHDYFMLKLNRITRVFELSPESDIIPSGKFIFNPKGFLWIIQPQGFIYQYELNKGSLQKIAPMPDDIRNLPFDYGLAISQDDYIYFLRPLQEVFSINDLELFRFSIETKKFERNIRIELESESLFYSIFIDRSNRLWAGNTGVMNANHGWNQIFKPSIFLETYESWSGPNYDYSLWLYPRIVLETSDDRLWFSSENGLAWLEPEKNQWCWVTNVQKAGLQEDRKKNLWLLVGGRLYKTKIEE